MGLKDFLTEIDEEIQSIISSEFEITITETETVPNVDDTGITYDDLDNNRKKGKRIETCILYIDIRRSTEISVNHKSITLTRLYSAFVRSMVKAATYYKGHVRGIVGDRVMVVFDKKDCFTNAIDTAVLLNSIAKYQLNKYFEHDEIKCGIGIDYGKMLVIKTGVIKQGKENQFYKSLVWLGRPANVASKLTDRANKRIKKSEKGVSVGLRYPLTGKWNWVDMSIESLVNNIDFDYIKPTMKYKDEYFSTFIQKDLESSKRTSPILITEEVFNGFKKNNPERDSIKKNWWKKETIDIDGYNGIIYAGDIHYVVVKDI